MTADWMRDERPRLAAERILDAAASCTSSTASPPSVWPRSPGRPDVPGRRCTATSTAGSRCSSAFVHREARRIGALVAEEVSAAGDPKDVIVEAMLAAIRLVRADPTLAAWFQLGDSGLAAQIAHSSDVIESLGAAFLGQAGFSGEETSRKARWLVRIIVSLLTVPGVDDTDERTMLEQFVAPALAEHDPGRA